MRENYAVEVTIRTLVVVTAASPEEARALGPAKAADDTGLHASRIEATRAVRLDDFVQEVQP